MDKLNLKQNYDFNSIMLNHFLTRTADPKIQFSEITNWHSSHPYYRLNYYNNIQVSQVLGIYLLFNKDWLSQFDNIIEIGSYNGGLSSYIFDNRKANAYFASYDIDPSINTVVNEFKRTDINFVIGDCFDETIFKEIADGIQQEGKTLLICDGGFKTREFNDFSKYLKKDDIIILHDYKDENQEELFFEAKEYWQWPYMFECSYDSIKEAVINNNLEKYDYDKFLFYLWGAFIKK
jgi:hypothetical protein